MLLGRPVTRKDRLVGLVVKATASRAEDPGVPFTLAPWGFFSGSSHAHDLKIGTPVATLPGAWRYRVSVGTGRPGVSKLCLGEVEGWICDFCLSVAARKLSEWIRPWDTLAFCWAVKQLTNNINYQQRTGPFSVAEYHFVTWLK